MVEVWKDIAGFEGLYQVSTLGNVKSLDYKHTGKEKILRPGLMKNGYLMVMLYKDKKVKKYYVHRLVAKAFIPNPNRYPCVNHKNGNRQANFVENLEWCSYSYNLTYKDRHLIVAKPIFCIELDRVFPSSMEAERITGVSHSSIVQCLKGRYKTAGGYHWAYAPK